MGQTQTVIEVDGWQGDRLPGTWGSLKDSGVLGVLVKVSQGVDWVNPHAATIVREATAAGLLVGALHFCEVEGNAVKDEVEAVLGNLPPGGYALGVVLEVDHVKASDPWGFTTDLQAGLGDIAAAGYRAGLRMTAGALSEVTGAPWAAQWWAASAPLEGQGQPFARWLGDPLSLDGDDSLRGYVIVNMRGLNPLAPVMFANSPGVVPGSAILDVPPVGLDDAQGDQGEDDVRTGIDSVEDSHAPESSETGVAPKGRAKGGRTAKSATAGTESDPSDAPESNGSLDEARALAAAALAKR